VTLDPDAIDRLVEITGGDQAFVDELVDTFLEDAERQIAALQAASENVDIVGVVRPAHSLKSNSVNVGATVLAEQCRSLEADARTGEVPDLGTRVAAVAAEFAAVRGSLLAKRAAR
jgi:HPt (histidine-containing phosphotransfer) domain-containing protein